MRESKRFVWLILFTIINANKPTQKTLDDNCNRLSITLGIYSISFCDAPEYLYPMGFTSIEKGKYKFFVRRGEAESIIAIYGNNRKNGFDMLLEVIVYSNQRDIVLDNIYRPLSLLTNEVDSLLDNVIMLEEIKYQSTYYLFADTIVRSNADKNYYLKEQWYEKDKHSSIEKYFDDMFEGKLLDDCWFLQPE